MKLKQLREELKRYYYSHFKDDKPIYRYIIVITNQDGVFYYKGNKWNNKSYSIYSPDISNTLVYKSKKTALKNFLLNDDFDLQYKYNRSVRFHIQKLKFERITRWPDYDVIKDSIEYSEDFDVGKEILKMKITLF